MGGDGLVAGHGIVGKGLLHLVGADGIGLALEVVARGMEGRVTGVAGGIERAVAERSEAVVFTDQRGVVAVLMIDRAEDAVPVARISELFPEAWAWNPEAAKQCTSDYLMFGWTSIIPESCQDATLIVPINRQWMFWGWPNRLTARMTQVNARVIVTGPHASGAPNTGLTLPEQLGDIPRSFNGYVWVDDIWTVGPALYPAVDSRTQQQIEAANAGLERRRESQ